MNVRKMLDNLPYAMSGINVDKALELRDVEEFDSEWMRVYNLVEQRKSNGSWDKEKSDKIRKEAFKKSLSACYNAEISALVSDDFGLMYDAKALKIRDPWLDKLISEYECNMFPCGQL